MPERHRPPETTTDETDDNDVVARRMAERAANIALLEPDQTFAGHEPKDDEIGLDDVRKFLDYPPSLPVEKIPSLVKYYGHVSEVASRLISRDDCTPEAVSSICQYYGKDPVFANYLIKNKGQLADDDNRQLYEANHPGPDPTLTVNQLYYQQLPEDINWQIYNDYRDVKYILLVMIHRQSNLPPDLVRQFYDDYGHNPEFVISLAGSQQLPEGIARQSFEQHKHLPGFVATLFRQQKDLPIDLTRQAYYDYDRSFESVLANSWAADDGFDDSVIYALERILPDGGVTIDLSNMRQIRIGQPDEKASEIPGSVIDWANQEARTFMGFIVSLLAQNRLDEEMNHSIYNDLGNRQAVAMTMFESQQSIPPDIIRQACEDYGRNIMFVEVLFKNQKGLPADIIEPIYQRHRWSPLFNGNWLAGQINLTAEEQQEASRWRHITDSEDQDHEEPRQKDPRSQAL